MQKLAEAREAHVGEVEYELRVAREDVAELRARLAQPRAAGDGGRGAAAGHAERGGSGGADDAHGCGAAPDGGRGPTDEPQAVEGEAAGAAAGGLGEGALALSARCAASATDQPLFRRQPPLVSRCAMARSASALRSGGGREQRLLAERSPRARSPNPKRVG